MINLGLYGSCLYIIYYYINEIFTVESLKSSITFYFPNVYLNASRVQTLTSVSKVSYGNLLIGWGNDTFAKK